MNRVKNAQCMCVRVFERELGSKWRKGDVESGNIGGGHNTPTCLSASACLNHPVAISL